MKGFDNLKKGPSFANCPFNLIQVIADIAAKESGCQYIKYVLTFCEILHNFQVFKKT